MKILRRENFTPLKFNACAQTTTLSGHHEHFTLCKSVLTQSANNLLGKNFALYSMCKSIHCWQRMHFVLETNSFGTGDECIGTGDKSI